MKRYDRERLLAGLLIVAWLCFVGTLLTKVVLRDRACKAAGGVPVQAVCLRKSLTITP